jgi:hypothetical protein
VRKQHWPTHLKTAKRLDGSSLWCRNAAELQSNPLLATMSFQRATLPLAVLIMGLAAAFGLPGMADSSELVLPSGIPEEAAPANSTFPCGPACQTCVTTIVTTPGGVASQSFECMDAVPRNNSTSMPRSAMLGPITSSEFSQPATLDHAVGPFGPLPSGTLFETFQRGSQGAVTPNKTAWTNPGCQESGWVIQSQGACTFETSQWGANQNTKSVWPCSVWDTPVKTRCAANSGSCDGTIYWDGSTMDLTINGWYTDTNARARMIGAGRNLQGSQCGSWFRGSGWWMPTSIGVRDFYTGSWMLLQIRNRYN